MLTKQDRKDEKREDVLFAYWDKKISRKVAVARLKELDYVEWEINLYLDNDESGPE